jgi:NADP-dependent 3-hydroxy acid dehydrogenase YdfG
VTVIEPGLVVTPLIHVYPEADALGPDVVPLDPAEVATIIRFALERPASVDLFEIVVRPTSQAL